MYDHVFHIAPVADTGGGWFRQPFWCLSK